MKEKVFFQFLGAFAGGACGGVAMQYAGAGAVFALCAVLAAIWALVAAFMQRPADLVAHVVTLSGDRPAAQERLRTLQAAAGVVDLLLLEDEGKVYLKVDGAVFDPVLLDEPAT